MTNARGRGPLRPFGSRRASARAKIAMIILPPLLLVGVAEVGTRAFLQIRYGKQVPTENWTFEYEPYLVMKKAGKVHRSYPVGDDQYRVLLLGGSTAAQLPDDVMREAVEAHTDREVVIINLAENGYILNQEKVILMLRGISSRPDLIISLDGANDFVITSKLHRTGETYQAGLVEMAVERPFLNAVFAVARKSQFVNALAKFRERRAERAFQADAELEDAVIDHLIEGWNAISTVAKGLGVPYVMVLQPYVHLKQPLSEAERRVASSYDYRRSFMTRAFSKTYRRMSSYPFAGSPYVVEGSAFFDDLPDVHIFSDEVHMTQQGNRRLAQELIRVPVSRGLKIPRSSEQPTRSHTGPVESAAR